MYNYRSIFKLLFIALIAFIAGFIVHMHLANTPPFHEISDKSQPVQIQNTAMLMWPRKSEGRKTLRDLNELDKDRYQKLVKEYFDYIHDENTSAEKITFNEFLSVRKDELIQLGEYTEEDARLEKTILENFNNAEPINPFLNFEINTYTINGHVVGPNKDENLCLLSDEKNLNIIVDVYLKEPVDLFPSIPKGGILPEQPLASTFVDCLDGTFDLKFTLSNVIGDESPPIYIVASAFDGVSFNYLEPIAIGTDKNTNGVPPSLLSRRKNNPPIKIKLNSLQSVRKKMDSIINIKLMDFAGKPIRGLMLLPYGIDSLSKFTSDFNLFRTSISGPDGIARLKPLPISSNLYFEIIDPKQDIENHEAYSKTSFTLITSSSISDIEIPLNIKVKNLKNKSSLFVIPPRNIKKGEIILSSKTSRNKSFLSFSNPNVKPLIINNLDPVETFLELRIKGKSVGLMPLLLRKDNVTIVEPHPKVVNKLSGTIKLINTLDGKRTICSNCKINIKYTDKSVRTDNKGNFIIKELSLIDNIIDINLNTPDLNVLVPIILYRSLNSVHLDLVIPSKTLIDSWNKTIPTLPNNGIVYGEYPSYKSYHAFIIGIDNDTNKEAHYFDNKYKIPTRKMFTTPYPSGKSDYGKFLFPDIPPGQYILYLVTNDKILHSRRIEVKSGKMTLLI